VIVAVIPSTNLSHEIKTNSIPCVPDRLVATMGLPRLSHSTSFRRSVPTFHLSIFVSIPQSIKHDEHNRGTTSMKSIQISRTIAAPLAQVFQAVSDVRNFREAVPHITQVEFLSDQKVGVGTRFRETRLMNGREHTVELEVAEYAENDRVRMISDAGGTIWDTIFTVSEGPNNVTLEMQMDIKPHTLLARIMTPLIRKMVVKGVESDMDSIKAFCESKAEQTG
jgi:uncharacterized protein YndB with AHSA1/START domain